MWRGGLPPPRYIIRSQNWCPPSGGYIMRQGIFLFLCLPYFTPSKGRYIFWSSTLPRSTLFGGEVLNFFLGGGSLVFFNIFGPIQSFNFALQTLRPILVAHRLTASQWPVDFIMNVPFRCPHRLPMATTSRLSKVTVNVMPASRACDPLLFFVVCSSHAQIFFVSKMLSRKSRGRSLLLLL